MNISCNTVEDIFILYSDGALSEKTRAEVKRHLSHCRNCAKYYRDMEKAYRNPHIFSKDTASDAEFEFEKVARKLRRAKIRNAVISNSASILAFTAGVLATATVYRRRNKKHSCGD